MADTATAEYTVRLPIFEGPLDLLLHLIKINELEIGEISISHITEQYLEYLHLMEKLDLDVAGEFLVIAATLLNIKLRSLLPASEDEVEPDGAGEELDDFISARGLMQRLIEYRRFKEAGQHLGDLYDHSSRLFVREVALPRLAKAEADPASRGDLSTLLEAFARVLRFVDRQPFHSVQGEEYHVDEKITLLRRRLLVRPNCSMQEIFGECRARLEMIVTLIALLEMCRLKEITISQPEPYGDAFIFRREHDSDLIELSDQNEQMRRTESEILAQRTGVIDDGIPLAEEDEDDLLESVEGEMISPGIETESEIAPPESEDEEDHSGVQIIDISGGVSPAPDGADEQGPQ